MYTSEAAVRSNKHHESDGTAKANEGAGRFLGVLENEREVQMDMREMVDKVKKGEPLYGHSTLSPYMQGVAARNSRFSSLLAHVVPWANFVNHNQVCGVDFARPVGD